MARAIDGKVLERLFGSALRVKLLRFFILNPNEAFSVETVAARVRTKGAELKRELDGLATIEFIKKTTVVASKDSKMKKKVPGFQLVRDFPYLSELAELLESAAPHARDLLLHRVRSAGRISLLIITGKLLGYETEHVDVFIVGDALKKAKIEKLLHDIESEIGKELVYAIMLTQEFQYRHGMNDRFVSRLLAASHEVLINKLGVLTPMREERKMSLSSDSE